MRRFITTVAATLALAVGAVTATTAPAPVRPAATELVETSFGCTVILRTTGPALLDDANHHCDARFTGASVDAAGTLTVTYTPVTEIVDAQVSADESVTATSYGPSVGLDLAWFRFRNSAGTVLRGDAAGVACGSCNIFIRVWALVPAVDPSPSPTP